MSRREAQEDFNRSGGGIVSEHLKALVTDKWLVRSEESTRIYAHEYIPGRQLTSNKTKLKIWQQLADQLFSANGLLIGLSGRSAFGTNFLGLNRMLIIGVLQRSKRPLSVPEIYQYIGFFMSISSVYGLFKRLEQNEIAVKVAKKWTLTSDFDRKLWEYERDVGALKRSVKIKRRNESERGELSIRLKGGQLTHAEETAIKKDGCVRCRTLEGKLQIEHFPPRHWGGKDHPDIALAICPQDNNRYSNKIKKYPAPELAKFVHIGIREGDDIRLFVLAKLDRNIHRFYKAFDEKRDDDAQRIVSETFSLWKATIEGTIPLRVTKLRDGKQVKPPYSKKGISIREKTGEIGTRYVRLRLVKYWPDGPALNIVTENPQGKNKRVIRTRGENYRPNHRRRITFKY